MLSCDLCNRHATSDSVDLCDIFARPEEFSPKVDVWSGCPKILHCIMEQLNDLIQCYSKASLLCFKRSQCKVDRRLPVHVLDGQTPLQV